MTKKKTQGLPLELPLEELLEQALVLENEQPYAVPTNWVWTRFENLNEYSGQSVNPMNQPSLPFELYSVPSCENDYPEILTGSEIGSTKQFVMKNDVLLCKINPRINRVWSVTQYTDYQVIASSEWIVFRNHKIISDYIKQCFQAKYFREYMLSNVSGVGGSLMRAQPKFVNQYPIPLPPLAEQHRIAKRIESLFVKLDKAKDLIQEGLDSFEKRKVEILHKAFSGDLTAKWRKEHIGLDNIILDDIKKYSLNWTAKDQKFICDGQKQSHIVEMGNGYKWIQCKIGGIGRVTNGSTPSRKCPEYWNGNIFWVSSGEVRNNIIQSTTEMITQEGFDNTSVKFLPIGTVLIAMIGEGKTRGQSAILNISATTNQNIAAIIIDHGFVNSKFLWYWLQKEYVKNREKGAGSGPQALNCQRVRDLDFILPTLYEQEKIVSILDRILFKKYQIKDSEERVLEQIENMKKAILARAFRGELGTNDPSEENAKELLKKILQEKL